MIDTLRADALGAYGAPEDATPALDAFAREAIVFDRARAPAPWTLPSVASILTSRTPCEHGLAVDRAVLAPSIVPWAERLQAAGWATASLYANPYAGPVSGLGRGFDTLALDRATGGPQVEAWLASEPRRPFFLYVHTIEPHAPYEPGHEEWQEFGHEGTPERRRVNHLLKRYQGLKRADFARGRPIGTTDNSAQQQAVMRQLSELEPRIRTLYAEDVHRADERFAEVVAVLERAGEWDRTIVAVTSDHGEEFGEHGGWQHDQSLYDELLRVPLLVRVPGGEGAGRRVTAPFSLVELIPTLLRTAGAPPALGPDEGRPLAAWLSPDAARTAPDAPRAVALRRNLKKYYRPFKQARGDLNVAVLEGSWKGIWNDEPGTLELYDLASDPGETRDRSLERPELARRLREAASDWLQACRTAGAGEAPEEPGPLDDASREQLRALGYID